MSRDDDERRVVATSAVTNAIEEANMAARAGSLPYFVPYHVRQAIADRVLRVLEANDMFRKNDDPRKT